MPLDFIAIMGNHAVWLFFVLSGFVLSRMSLEDRVPDYGRYVLGRLARLYLPVWGALAIVLIVMLAVPRTVTGLGAWVTGHPAEATVSDFVKDMFLLLGTSGNLSPLWSLQWEVLFSLLLIVYVTLLQKVPVGVGFTLLIALAFLGAYIGNVIIIYMPMFGLGVCLALSRGLELSISLIALTLLLVVASFHEPTRWFLERRSVQWLGLVSVSLYLTHEPIILLFTYLSQANLLWVLVGLATTLPVAFAFYRFVERPAHLISRRFR